MSQTLTVVVPSHDPGTALATSVAGIDAQTLRTDRFDVVVVDAGSTDGSLDRLRRLARTRPHVSVIADADLAAGVQAATGAYVLVVEPGTRVLPEALARMSAATQQDGGVDVVVGRRRLGSVVAAGPLVAPADSAALAGPLASDLVDAWAEAALLVRRELLVDALATDSDRWPTLCLQRAERVALVTDYACLLTPSRAKASSALRFSPAVLRWTGATLRVELSGVVPAGAAVPEQYAFALAGVNGVEHLLPTRCSSDAASADGETTLTAVTEIALDPAATPVPPGSYRLRLRVSGADGGLRAVRTSSPVSAVIDGQAVVVRTGDDGNLDLDVGARASSVVSSFAPAQAAVTETARGSLLRVSLPELHIHGAGTVDGLVSLGGLRLPATLVAADRSAELRCFVSGLEGRSALGVRFGSGEVVPTGCDLVMSHLGGFTVETARTDAPAPTSGAPESSPAPKPDTTEPAAKVGPTAGTNGTRRSLSRAQHLRRAVPEPLEPLVRSLAGFGPARDLYRRLLRR